MYSENIFTKIIKKAINSEVVFENEYVLVINDIAPKAKNHWLILPKNNYSDLKDFLNNASEDEQLAFFDCIKNFLNKVEYANVQFNIGEKAGQEVMHLHAHIISDY
ncbi:HIT family protein [Alphaproteobacteria bacterium endosymbiont of Tiliacea citrago]|uniref:HIT family protein n=1 Tax=Alphaproteobacteria bacterium endosymbiont of Tiliacea citrago TaxID=3077944 RepID=UPI00313C6BEB